LFIDITTEEEVIVKGANNNKTWFFSVTNSTILDLLEIFTIDKCGFIQYLLRVVLCTDFLLF
jgi:hypothetical protein